MKSFLVQPVLVSQLFVHTEYLLAELNCDRKNNWTTTYVVDEKF